ncbi:MAG: PD-(D/E)XK motif protein [Ureaplasma sp.]|nr:PD-(D/E)XK motif protein [Ureaplasma sp.]
MWKNNDFLISSKDENENICIIFFKKGLVQEKDKKMINKIDSFNFLDTVELNDYEGIYEKIEINFSNDLDLKDSLIQFLFNVKKEFDKNPNNDNPLIRIINFWKLKNNTNLEIENLKGDIGEALLILKFAELGYDIQNNLRNKDNELYDFFFEKSIIEVKTTSVRSNEIKINDSQMLTSSIDKNIHIIVVKTKYLNKVLSSHKNILDIYDAIDEKIGLNNSLLKIKKETYQTLDQQIIDNNSIDINDYHFYLMDYKKIRDSKINKPKGLKDLIYVFDVSDLEKINDEELKELI